RLALRPVYLFGGALALELPSGALAATHKFPLAATALGVAGASWVVFTATVNSTLQLDAPDQLRGRVMAVYTLVLGGMNPLGALVSGTLAQIWGASGAFGIGGLAGLAAVGAVAHWRLRAGRGASSFRAGAAPARAPAGGGREGLLR